LASGLCGLWCQIAIDVGCIGFAMVIVVGDGGYSDLVKVVGGMWKFGRDGGGGLVLKCYYV
jgi:hypothetical protein